MGHLRDTELYTCHVMCVVCLVGILTLLEPQSRFGDNLGHTTWNLTGVSPKRDCSSKGVKVPTRELRSI